MKSFLLVLYIAYICNNVKAGLIKYTSIEDLSHPLDENTIYWAKDESFKLNVVRAAEVPDIGWVATNTFSAGEHGGTHLDAPYHFNKNGWKVGDIPIRNFIAEGVLIDVAEKVKDNRDFQLSAQDLKDWEVINGEIPKHGVLLIKFGWSHRYVDKVSYLGSDKPPYSFPSISKEAAEYIVSKNVIGVGLDVASVDPGDASTLDTHKTFASANIYNLENVNLHSTRLPPKGCDLIILPMKIAKGTGGPVRIVALC